MERLVLWHRIFPPTRLEQDVPERIAEWVDRTTGRFCGAGATSLGAVGGSTAIAFDLTELREAIDIALAVLDDVEESDVGPLGASIGVATGELIQQGNRLVGSAIDRAQLLACRARKGELVVDAATRELCNNVFLFGRSVGTGAAALRGQAVDRNMPRRSLCRATIAKLGPPVVAPITKGALEVVREIAFLGRGTVVLRGPSGGGARFYIDRLAEELNPPFVLCLGNVPGAIEPFGSLRLALLQTFDRAEKVEERVGPVLGAVARGEPVPPAELKDALTKNLESAWVLFDPVPSIDPSSVTVLADVLENCPFVAIARVPVDAPLPKPLRAHQWHDVVLPSLRVDDAKEVARSVLGEGVDEDVVRRVAVLGGDTPLGVMEAARTLVAVGDLIHDGTKIVWRTAPRSGVRSIPTEQLLNERLAGLEDAPLRMLEAICLTPPGTPRLLVAAIAERDGLSMEQRREATTRLRAEAWVEGGTQLRPTSELLRRLVLHRIPPGRTSELCRFAVGAMRDSKLFSGPLVEATLGYYLAEGGDTQEGAEAILRVADATLEAGYRYTPRRLAAAAVQIHPLGEVRTAASRIARNTQDSGDAPRGDETRVSQIAVNALLAGDIDAVERTIEAAIAEGRDLGAADRLRAMVHLAKGDTEAAMRAFGRQRDRADDKARSYLTLAWILLHTGDALAAVRAGLAALSFARRAKDPRGEGAAMHTLAACFRTLGRDGEADTIADAAPV